MTSHLGARIILRSR